MNTLDTMLQDELNRLLDRIAVRAGEDTSAGLKSDLRAPIERCEDRLTVLRAALLDGYAEIARTTDELVASLADLDQSHPLPEAPWFEPGAHWSARRAVLHIIAETSQHAGHADIIREAIDGAKTMG